MSDKSAKKYLAVLDDCGEVSCHCFDRDELMDYLNRKSLDLDRIFVYEIARQLNFKNVVVECGDE